LEQIVADKLVSSGVLAQDTAQISNFWNARESIPEACAKEGAVYKYDLSIPFKSLYDLVPIMKERLGTHASSVLGYGHVGDGNIHLNISTARFTEKVAKIIEPFVYEYTGIMPDIIPRICKWQCQRRTRHWTDEDKLSKVFQVSPNDLNDAED
jgi:FAD/FMN-containing dehydrogenase